MPENNDYLALFAHDMVEKGYITEDYIGNYDLLKTYYALCLSGGTWPFLDSLYELYLSDIAHSQQESGACTVACSKIFRSSIVGNQYISAFLA